MIVYKKNFSGLGLATTETKNLDGSKSYTRAKRKSKFKNGIRLSRFNTST